MIRRLLLLVTHLGCLLIGLAGGIYLLPILTAAPVPGAAQAQQAATAALAAGSFRRDLADSDLLHWGEGQIHVGRHWILHQGRLAPGPDYQLYLAPEFIETEADFLRLQPQLQHVGPVDGFEGFLLPVPEGVDVTAFGHVVIWCRAFGQFITAASLAPIDQLPRSD